jgi:Mg-chelatase subunit ChlD
MPAPKSLALLPKPVLFGLYGAIGGLVGALAFAELLYYLLTPSGGPAVNAGIGVVASSEVEVFVEGRNTFPVQIARDNFDGPVTVRLEGLPGGVAAEPVTIAPDKSAADVFVAAGLGTAPVASHSAKVVAEATVGGKTVSAYAPISFKITDPPKPLADIVFVLDVTNSMQWAIDDLKDGIGTFADSLVKARVDFRLALVTFQDLANPGEKVEVIRFKGEPFTAQPATFRDEAAKLKAAGGGDIPESSLEGVSAACDLPFRKDATRVLLLLTDAPPKAADVAGAVRSTADRVKGAKIDACHVVGLHFDEAVYKPLLAASADKAGGKYFDLKDVVGGDEGFTGLLSNFGGVVTAAAIAKNPDTKPKVASGIDTAPKVVKSLQSDEQLAAGTEGKLVLRSGVWTAAIAALICLALLGGQTHYLRGTLPRPGGLAVGIAGGLGVGLVGGAAGQGLFFLAPDSTILANLFRIVGWVLLGGLAGGGLALFIPNMRAKHGLLGGAIGGAGGAVAFIIASSATGDFVGRLVGGLVLGFFIGIMVAIAESAFRQAWLEVRFSGGEKISVNLGPEPVKVGSDPKTCTVWARGAAPLASRFFVRDGQVICDDSVNKSESTVSDGFSKEIGNLTVIVHTSASATPVRTERPPPAKATQPQLDDDDDFYKPAPSASPPKPAAPLKKPVAAPAAPPKAAPIASPPKPAVPPKPVAPPAPKPVAKPFTKAADACPGCSRVIAGSPGSRYCMVCDMSY